MMKRLFLLAVLSAITLGATAQEKFNEKKSYIVERAKNNWFMEFGVNGNVYMGQEDNLVKFKHRIAPGGTVSFGKWVTPWMGFKFGLDFAQYKGAVTPNESGNFIKPGEMWSDGQQRYDIPGLMKQKFFAFNPNFNMFFSMMNMMGNVKEKRVYDIILQFGGGFMVNSGNKVDNMMGYGKYTYYAPTLNIGFIQKFRLCAACDLNIDIKGAWVGNEFDGQVYTDDKGYKTGDFVASLGISLTYKFKPRKSTAYKPWIIKDTAESAACYAKYRELQAAKQSTDQMNQALRDSLNYMKKHPMRDTVVITEVQMKDKPRTMLGFVEFANGSAKISSADKAKLVDIAEQIKANPQCQYEVCGYADNTTGSKALNDKLRGMRAAAAIAILENSGVSANLLKKATNDGKPGDGISPRAIVINKYDCK